MQKAPKVEATKLPYSGSTASFAADNASVTPTYSRPTSVSTDGKLQAGSTLKTLLGGV